MAESPRTSWLATLGWACYLACSWTWCIGMFLPVLLIRDYGVWGFVVFAVPNVVGAAAMGWVLKNPGAADRVRKVHRAGLMGFSTITRIFHYFWLLWLLLAVSWIAGLVGMALGAGALGIGAFASRRGELEIRFAAVTYFVSAAVIVVYLASGWTRIIEESTPSNVGELAWLVPVCVFGFVLCPYLDGTFLRARGALPGATGTSAFLVAFAVLFPPLILFSVGYSGWMPVGATLPVVPFVIGVVLFAHFFAQAVFTASMHGIEMTGCPDGACPAVKSPVTHVRRWIETGGLPMALGLAALTLPAYHGLSAGEVIYRLFMAFYGLVFPAYVWLCMIPTRDGHSGLGGAVGRRKLVVWGVAVVLAAPAFWMGFIERVEWWLAPGLGVVLLARLLIPGGGGFGRLRRLTRERQGEEEAEGLGTGGTPVPRG